MSIQCENLTNFNLFLVNLPSPLFRLMSALFSHNECAFWNEIPRWGKVPQFMLSMSMIRIYINYKNITRRKSENNKGDRKSSMIMRSTKSKARWRKILFLMSHWLFVVAFLLVGRLVFSSKMVTVFPYSSSVLWSLRYPSSCLYLLTQHCWTYNAFK